MMLPLCWLMAVRLKRYKSLPTNPGFKLSCDMKITPEFNCRIARASKAFGCLRVSVFLNCTLSTDTKRAVYKAVVVSFLL